MILTIRSKFFERLCETFYRHALEDYTWNRLVQKKNMEKKRVLGTETPHNYRPFQGPVVWSGHLVAASASPRSSTLSEPHLLLFSLGPVQTEHFQAKNKT